MFERRLLNSCETRAKQFGKRLRVSGYAARYGVLSKQLSDKTGQYKFRERIASRAFDDVLDSSDLDCIATMNHDVDKILGRTKSGTLRLRSDDNGLFFDCDLPNTTYALDLYESINRGDMSECSFAFGPCDDEYGEEDVEGERSVVRTIKRFGSLRDVSIVTSPAYSGTSVIARSAVVADEVRSRVELCRKPLVTDDPDFIRLTRETNEFLENARRVPRARRNLLLDIL
jgi:uncharacterized protein